MEIGVGCVQFLIIIIIIIIKIIIGNLSSDFGDSRTSTAKLNKRMNAKYFYREKKKSMHNNNKYTYSSCIMKRIPNK